MKIYLLAAAMTTALPAATQASVVYQFVGVPNNLGGSGPPQSFELVVPSFLQVAPGGNLSFGCGQLRTSLNCGEGVIFLNFSGNPFGAAFQFNASNSTGYPYTFPTGAFENTGTYYSQDFGDPKSNSGYLLVGLQAGGSGPPPSDVPEPASVLLALTGLAVGGTLRFLRWKESTQ